MMCNTGHVPLTEPQMRKIFEDFGLYKPFDCPTCRKADIFVSGPHSHVCECGAPATFG